MLFRGITLGFGAGILSSILVIFLGGMIVGAGGSDLVWMILVLTVPATVAGLAIGYAGTKVERNKFNGRILALAVAIVSVTLAGAVMAPTIQALYHGWNRVNVSGYLEWGPRYGVLMLPLSYPLARLLVKLIWSDVDNRVTGSRPN